MHSAFYSWCSFSKNKSKEIVKVTNSESITCNCKPSIYVEESTQPQPIELKEIITQITEVTNKTKNYNNINHNTNHWRK